MILYLFAGISVLKKHYNDLLWSLPANAFVTLGKLCNLRLDINDEVYGYCASLSSLVEVNKTILSVLIYTISNDYQLLSFCCAMKILAEDVSVIKSLTNG